MPSPWEELPGILKSVLDLVVPQIKEPLREYYQLRREISSTFLAASPIIFNFTVEERSEEVSEPCIKLDTFARKLGAWPDSIPRSSFWILRCCRLVRSRKELDEGWHLLLRISKVAQIPQKKEVFWMRCLHDDSLRAQQLLDLNLGMKEK